MEKEKDENLSKKEVEYAVEFARSLWDTDNQFGIFSPDLLHQLLIDLNIHPVEADYDKIVKALNKAKDEARTLQGYSQWMEYNDMLYSRYIQYYSNMLSFDLRITDNAPKEKKNSKEYKVDREIVEKFCSAFDYKREFHKLVVQMMKNEIVFTWMRSNGDSIGSLKELGESKFTLQIMPQLYCRTTGYWEKGILFDFDMNWFLRAGVDINGYDPSFMKKYREIFVDGDSKGIQDYIPTNPLGNRDGTFAYWVQTSPKDGAWCFKRDESNFNTVPFLAPFLQNVVDDRQIQQLQKNKDIAGAYALLVGELKMMTKQVSGQTSDAFAVNPKTLSQFMRLIQKGMKSTIQVGAMPTENTNMYQFQDYNKEMYKTALTTTSGLGASASRSVYATDKMSQAELEAALTNDIAMMTPIYKQFNAFMNYYVNMFTKTYKFNFVFEGTPFGFERERRQRGLIDLADRGMMLDFPAWAQAYGYDPFEFERLLVGASSKDMDSLLTRLPSIYTSSNDSNGHKKGRPRKSRVKTHSRDYDNSNAYKSGGWKNG